MNQRHYSRKATTNLYSADGRPIATVQHDQLGRMYSRKTLSGSKHFLRTPPGIGFDNATLQQADALGVRYHVVFDQETRKSYCADHHLFKAHGFPVCRGFNPQTALGMQYWSEGDQPPASLFDTVPGAGFTAGVTA